MQLTFATIAGAIALSAVNALELPIPPWFKFNDCSNDPFPAGTGLRIGPTNCTQLVDDCNYHGPGEVCSVDYKRVTYCYDGEPYGREFVCPDNTACTAARDGRGAICEFIDQAPPENPPDNGPPPPPFNPFEPPPSPPASCPDRFPAGYGAAIGPTSCHQPKDDCGNDGPSWVCTIGYDGIKDCLGGVPTGSGYICLEGTQCLAAKDGSSAGCVRI